MCKLTKNSPIQERGCWISGFRVEDLTRGRGNSGGSYPVGAMTSAQI